MQLTSILSLVLAATVAVASPTPVEKRSTSCSPVGISAQSSAAVVAAFKSSGVVPTLIPSISPQVAVSVNYGSKSVNLGNEFTTAQTLTAPALSFSAETNYNPSTTKYAYFLVDPDVPNPQSPVRVNFLHWAVHNAQPSCITSQSPVTDTIYEPLTPASTQQHRYTFLVYRQPAGYTPDLVALQLRPGFDINGYAAKHGLVLVGGNFLREAITNGVIS